jgi:translocation and assembly module TamA
MPSTTIAKHNGGMLMGYFSVVWHRIFQTKVVVISTFFKPRHLGAGLIFGALALSGCTTLQPAPAAKTAAVADRADYELDIWAPDSALKLLTDHMDLARFQNAPDQEAINVAELERLMQAAPAQARALLETQGYFNADVTAQRVGNNAAGLPLLRLVVKPGPQVLITQLNINCTGELQDAVLAGSDGAQREVALLHEEWALPIGAPFAQNAWSTSKGNTLARLRANGYAAASWSKSSAQIDAANNTAQLNLTLNSGPLYRIGPLQVEGLSRFNDSTVRNLANFAAGDPYRERLLTEFQDRLQKVGLFESASVEIDPDIQTATAAPVRVRVKEFTMQQSTIGVGFSANTGARLSIEHFHRNVFGTGWRAKNKLALGVSSQSWEIDLTSHPLDGLYRNLLSGSVSRLRDGSQQLNSWTARVGRTQDTPRIERLIYAELSQAQEKSDTRNSRGEAISINYDWIYRDIDSVLLPTRGLTTTIKGAFGLSRGSLAEQDQPTLTAQGPFGRAYTRLTWYKPLLKSTWYGSARLEAGQVFTRNVIGLPATLLFRAGGDDSVRGYGYRSLGPTTATGDTVGGRSLFTASVELARPISPRYPAYWWAAFVDAGDAADRFADLRPAVGYGLGVRWRSPVGPLRVDVAYGQKTQKLRTHLSVGIAF